MPTSRHSRLPWKRLLAIVLLLAGAGFAYHVSVSGPSTSESNAMLYHRVESGDLLVTVTERGTLESSENTEIKCKVRGQNTITWVIQSGSIVEAGDELLHLDTLVIEDAIAERSKYAHWSRSGADSWKAQAARAKLAIEEYKDGRFQSQLMEMEKNLAIAESNLTTAQNMLDHAKSMSERGYVSELDVEESEFSVKQAELSKEVLETNISVLEKFTQAEELERLQGDWKAAVAEYEAAAERAKMDGIRRDQAVNELAQCVVKAQKPGMVIYPPTHAWKSTPDIEEGATVHKEQTLLLMPDLDKMQVRVGVHESVVERIKKGLKARVRLTDQIIDAEVSTVATVAQPTGWWSGNIVKYDTIVRLPSGPEFKPGMTAGVEIVLAEYQDVLKIPVAAVVETKQSGFVWVRDGEQPLKRQVELGDSNDIYIAVRSGLNEGDEVVLNPTAYISEAKELANEESEKDDNGEDQSV